MGQKPPVLITGVSGNLGLRVLPLLNDFDVIGVDLRPPENPGACKVFEKLDLAEERSCGQLLDLIRAYRPESIVHLAFIVDPMRAGVYDRQRMWQINVAGTGRVLEAIAEHNRMLGGIHKFIVPSSVSAYGPDLPKPVSEDAPLHPHTLPYALDKREADLTIQARAKSLKTRTYILRPHIFVGASVQNYMVGVLRGVPQGRGSLAEKLRARNKRLPLVVPSGGNYLEHKFQFVHVDDVARLIAHILGRRQTDSYLPVLNVAGRGDPLPLQKCAQIANIPIKRVPGRISCRLLLRLLWNLGISDIPPEALPYLLGSYTMDTSRLRIFLGDEYRKVIHYTCEEALAETFANEPSALSTQHSANETSSRLP